MLFEQTTVPHLVQMHADEPTGALDSASAAEVVAVLHAEGLSIVMVTHDPSVAQRAQRIVQLVDGRVGSSVSPADQLAGAAG